MAYESVVRRGVVLGVIITKMYYSWSPLKIIFPLISYVLYTLEAYADGLGPLLLQGFVGKFIGCGIVQLYSCWWFCVTHLYKSCAFWDRFLCIYKWCPNFCLYCWYHDIFHYFAHIMDGTILLGVFTVVIQIMIAHHSATRLGNWQVWYIIMDLQNHVALLVSENVCWVSCGVV